MIGWRAHLGKIYPAPAAGPVIREFYDVVPDGIDITIATLGVNRWTREEFDEAVKGVERATGLLASKGVDVIYLGGIPPMVIGEHGYHRKIASRMEEIGGRPACTDIAGVLAAFQFLGIKRIAMASPFEDWLNDLIKEHFAFDGIEIVHMKGLQIQTGLPLRSMPNSVEYTFAREVFRSAPIKPDAIYIPASGWTSARNIARLEQDLGVPVITLFNAMMWWFLTKTGVKIPIRGFGRLLESIYP